MKHYKGDCILAEKIKITRKEVEELYDIQEDDSHQEDQVEITEIPVESWEEATVRKDKDNKWLSE